MRLSSRLPWRRHDLARDEQLHVGGDIVRGMLALARRRGSGAAAGGRVCAERFGEALKRRRDRAPGEVVLLPPGMPTRGIVLIQPKRHAESAQAISVFGGPVSTMSPRLGSIPEHRRALQRTTN